jgi:hypothetical protein
MQEISNRLVLRYYPSGQFSFRHILDSATDEQLYATAMQLNAFQEDNVNEVRMVKVLEF